MRVHHVTRGRGARGRRRAQTQRASSTAVRCSCPLQMQTHMPRLGVEFPTTLAVIQVRRHGEISRRLCRWRNRRPLPHEASRVPCPVLVRVASRLVMVGHALSMRVLSQVEGQVQWCRNDRPPQSARGRARATRDCRPAACLDTPAVGPDMGVGARNRVAVKGSGQLFHVSRMSPRCGRG